MCSNVHPEDEVLRCQIASFHVALQMEEVLYGIRVQIFQELAMAAVHDDPLYVCPLGPKRACAVPLQQLWGIACALHWNLGRHECRSTGAGGAGLNSKLMGIACETCLQAGS